MFSHLLHFFSVAIPETFPFLTAIQNYESEYFTSSYKNTFDG